MKTEDTSFGGVVKESIFRLLSNYIVAFILLLIIIVVSFIIPSFFSLKNMENILKQISVIGILSCGMTYVIISGMIDLSVGSIISLAGVLYVRLFISSGLPVTVIGCLLAGAACGFISGGIVSAIKGKLGEAFIVTFGMSSILAATALIVSGGVFQQGPIDDSFAWLGKDITPILLFVLSIVIGQIFLTKTKHGRIMYFIGTNIEATRLSGIRVKAYRVFAFVLSGCFSGLAAMVLTSRVGAASPTAGTNYELDAIAAVVVGGVSLSGGSGTMMNTLLGVVVMGVLSNALTMLGITSYPQMIVKGCIIAITVAFDIMSKRKSEKRRIFE